MSAYRARSLPLFDEEPPRAPQVRRMVCACGCGRWFYVERRPGRPLEYATQECANMARNSRNRARSRNHY